MRVLPRLIAIHVIVMAIYTAAVTLLPFPDAYAIIIGTLIIAPIASAISTGYLVRMWLEDPERPRSELFAFLAYGAFILTLSLLLVGTLAFLRIVADIHGDQPYLSAEQTTAALGLSFTLVASVPVMKASLFFRFNRTALRVKVDDFARLEAQIAENTRLTQMATESAERAYHTANSVNEKIASQGAVLIQQGKDSVRDRAQGVEDRARGVRIEVVSDDTNLKVTEIHDRPKDAGHA